MVSFLARSAGEGKSLTHTRGDIRALCLLLSTVQVSYPNRTQTNLDNKRFRKMLATPSMNHGLQPLT
ncbi:hypothetical protein [Synechococcus sp. M16CYN]|uniref:hypothetical protein n=1 Tax=Synechococcus sp. M16CYN TaxID=3103139 RepID=UPI00334233EE